MNIKAVTFDAGGTLIKPWPSVGHVYAEAAAGHARIAPERLNERFAAVWQGAAAVQSSARGMGGAGGQGV